jgi:hypothetical protein
MCFLPYVEDRIFDPPTYKLEHRRTKFHDDGFAVVGRGVAVDVVDCDVDDVDALLFAEADGDGVEDDEDCDDGGDVRHAFG